MITQHFGLEDLFGSTMFGAGTEANSMSAAQLSIFRGEGESRESRAESREPEKALTLVQAVEGYLDATQSSDATRVEYRTTLRRYQEWVDDEGREPENALTIDVSDHRSTRPVVTHELTRDTLRQFLEWVHARAKLEGGTNPGRTANKRRANISAVLNWACDEGKIETVPRMPAKFKEQQAAGLYYLEHDEIDRLYYAAAKLRLRQWVSPTGISLRSYWQGAIAFFFSYGVDMGLVFASKRNHKPLLVRHVAFSSRCPDRSTKIDTPWGSIFYERGKTKKKRLLQMNKEVCLHLLFLIPMPAQVHDVISSRVKEASTIDELLGGSGFEVPEAMLDTPIFRGGSTKPSKLFKRLLKLGRIPKKINQETGEQSDFTSRDLRKTASTWHDENCPGAGSAILGHALPGSAAVTAKHYSNTSPLAAKSIMTIAQPSSIRSIWDDTIKPPGQLFAK